MLQCCSVTGKRLVYQKIFGLASRCVFVSQATICMEGKNTEQRKEWKSEQMQSNSEAVWQKHLGPGVAPAVALQLACYYGDGFKRERKKIYMYSPTVQLSVENKKKLRHLNATPASTTMREAFAFSQKRWPLFGVSVVVFPLQRKKSSLQMTFRPYSDTLLHNSSLNQTQTQSEKPYRCGKTPGDAWHVIKLKKWGINKQQSSEGRKQTQRSLISSPSVHVQIALCKNDPWLKEKWYQRIHYLRH